MASSPSPIPTGRRTFNIGPTALAYAIGPLALPVTLLLMQLGYIARRPLWVWLAVFAVIPLTSLVTDLRYRSRPSPLRLHIRVAQNAAAVAVVIYMSGWGPEMALAFTFVALANMALGGSRLWRASVVWSVLGIGLGQLSIAVHWTSTELPLAKANALAFIGAFVLTFVIRMAAGVMAQKEEAEQSLRRSEDRFRSLIQNSTDVTTVVSAEGVYAYVSPSITRMLGYEPEDLIGQPAANIVHEDERDGVSERIRTGTYKPGLVVEQFSVRAKDGSVRLVEAAVADMRDNASVAGFVANIRDITERATAARELERSKESFQVLFEQHPHPMWVYDTSTLRFLEVNECAVDRYGYTRSEFLSMTIMDIRPSEDVRRLVDHMRTERALLSYAGIWRHLTKDGRTINVEVTTHRIEFRGRQASLVMAQDVTERVRLEEQLRDHAIHDSLTGLPNRSLLLDRVDRLNAQARRSDTQATVLHLNLDHFKLVNEAYGHEVADGLLRAVGDRLVNELPQADTVGRMAADEFIVLAVAPVFDAQPELLAQRVLELISAQPFTVDGHEMSITTSIGVTSAVADCGAHLIQGADIALKLAKSEGGNRYVVFAREMQAAVDERVQLTMDLRAAVRTAQFENYYQPVVDVRNGHVVGIEALARWNHPTRGLIPPDQFIPLAEESGMIIELGRFVLHQACQQAVRWQQSQPDLNVAVNVSVFQLRSDQFFDDVRGALEASGLRPDRLVLEVTENVLISNPESVGQRLKALKELGVRLAIDDFGTGYSSLSYLRQFSFDILKIDRSFIVAMLESSEAIAMVRTMIHLARQLRLEVVAEGVEVSQQLDALRRLQCPSVQGYIFSRPLDAGAMTAWLAERHNDSSLASVTLAAPV